jgi:uncharacterized protein (TIGR03435 family)
MTASALSWLFSAWHTVAAPLANHLWQSTLFAALAGLLTLLLKKNHAQARYWIWLAASVKFLVPFSLLQVLGSHASWINTSKVGQSGFSYVVQEISQPFAGENAGHAIASSSLLASAIHLLPIIALLAWIGGCMVVLSFWWIRWQRMAKTLHAASPQKSGHELDMLRHLEHSQGTAKHIRLILSADAFEPGIVGVFRPALLLPKGISTQLTDEQLKAIMAHELNHVRRHDNLAAAFHMMVEALFWFHPLVWWMGARLLDERERACDEEVLHMGIQPQTYAESILKVCEFYLGSPLVCIAGVTGSNLKKRIEEIMIHRITHKLELGKKLLLATVAVSALAAPVVIGLLHPTAGHAQEKSAPSASPLFEDVLIQTRGTAQPNQAIHTGLHQNNELTQFTNFSLRGLVQYAYKLDESQVSGGPQWVTYDLFDVLTKTNVSIPEAQYRLELQKLLADRFKLAVHPELKDLPVFELVVGKNGPKLKAAQEGGHSLSQKPAGRLEATRISIAQFAELLGRETGKPVVDKTGLTGFYDFTLNWKSENTRTLPLDNTALLSALSEQLGLELQPANDPVPTVVIDHAEKIAGQ